MDAAPLSASSPLVRRPPTSPSLFLVLGTLLPLHGFLPVEDLASLSMTCHNLRQAVFGRLFSMLKVETALEDEEDEGESGESSKRPPAVSAAVRRVEWTLKGEEQCVEEDGVEEVELELVHQQRRRRTNELGKLIESLPSLSHLALTSHSFHSPTCSPIDLSPALLPFSAWSSLRNLSSLTLTGFSLPTSLLLGLLLATPNLLELTLQTFSPSTTPSSLPVIAADAPAPSSLPPTLPSSVLKHLHTFTGLASHVGVLLSGGTRSLKSLTVEMCGDGEALVRELEGGLPCHEGKMGLVELRMLGVELLDVEMGVRLMKELGRALKGKGGLEVLELGLSDGLENEGDVERLLTSSLPHLTAFASSLRSLTITTPTTFSSSPSSSFGIPPMPPTPLPLFPLSRNLPLLSTLTINSTLWRFLERPTSTRLPSRPTLTSNPSASNGLVGLNNNKKAARRQADALRCEVWDEASGSGSSEEE